MSFYHAPTFLRSALARDPFCHGGVIKPEDVLRLQMEFPTLFGQAPPQPQQEEPQKTAMPTTDVPNAPVKKCEEGKTKVGEWKANETSTGISKGTTMVVGQGHSKPFRKTMIRTKPITVATARRTAGVSQFHRNCTGKQISPKTEGPKKTVTPVTTIKSENNKQQRKAHELLCRPAQSFSLEDLKAALKQVLAEDMYQTKPKFDRSKSPYTEDLVKMFLGRKFQEHRRQKESQRKLTSEDFVEIFVGDGQRLETSATTLGSGSATSNEKELLPRSARGNVRQTSPQKGRLAGVRSAPGFLRGIPDLPRAPPLHRFQKVKRNKSEDIRKGKGATSSSRHVTWREDDRDHGGGDIRENLCAGTGDASPDYKEMCDYSRNSALYMQPEWLNNYPADYPARESSSNAYSKRPGSGVTIYLRSEKKSTTTENEEENGFVRDDRFSAYPSYYHRLASRSAENKLRIKGALRKQDKSCNFYTKQKEREGTQKHDCIKSSTCRPIKDVISESLFRREVGKETTHALQQIAEELVYTEILQQINELRKEQEHTGYYDDTSEEVKELQKSPLSFNDNDSAQKSMPRFIPTTSDLDSESEPKNSHQIKSTHEIILKTPELTPPSGIGRTQKRTVKEKENISLHTPQLSLSSPEIEANVDENEEAQKKLSQQENSLDTDCSELSDFAFTEANHPKRNIENESNHKNESLKLDTPTLSQSLQKINSSKKTPPQNQMWANKENLPEKEHSTLSGVSTFRESSSQRRSMQDEKVNGDKHFSEDDNHENELQNISAYSEDFVPEDATSHESKMSRGQGSTRPPARDAENKRNMKVFENIDDGQLNLSEDTVIDILSEGEFIGAAYRSPGELSLRKRQQGHPQMSFASDSRETESKSTLSEPPISSERSASEEVVTVDEEVVTINEEIVENSQISIISTGARVRLPIAAPTGTYLLANFFNLKLIHKQ